MACHFLHVLNLSWQATVWHLHYYSLNVIICAKTPLTEMGPPIS